jgi:S1-C subfamily serine protease
VGGQTVALPRRIVRFHRLDRESGVLVALIQPDSPASRSGLRTGDVLIAYDEHRIASIDDLQRLLTDERVGVESTLTVLRAGERLKLSIMPREAGVS